MPYDLFISYSRKDNQQRRMSELVEHIRNDHQAFTGEKLSCFFDETEIKAMDDWRNRILGGLRESKLLLLVLSPDYLASPYCEWEIVEFLKYEHSRALQGQGVAQVYFVEIPGLDTPDFDKQAAAWVARIRQRNHVDLRPWRDEGADALKVDDVRARLKDLERSLTERLSRLRRIVDAPGNLPAHNSHFVGREVEMERLHKAAGLGQYGVLTAVQGVGGMGKTALAIQYAYAYADFYPGGRWLASCAERSSLASVVRSLDSDLGIQFTDEEKLDDTRAAKHVLSELEKRAQAGATARAGENNPPEPRALLLLDNVDAPALLQVPNTDLLSGRKWLHVIATTRLDPDSIGMGDAYCHLPVDELPEEDALRLIESYQPERKFPNDAERAAALEIVRILKGFTLAIEVVAVHLGERTGRLACADLLKRLRHEGVDHIAGQTKGAVNHVEKLLSATLAPTLEALSEAENRTLTVASLLPPDSVPLPWMRAVVAETYPELAKDADPGYDDPWLTLVNHLINLRLLQVIEWADDARIPRLCRIHRLVQAVAKQRAGGERPAIANSLMNVISDRAAFLQEGWLDWKHRWEVKPLGAYSLLALDTGLPEAKWLPCTAAALMLYLGNYVDAESLYRRNLDSNERMLGPEHRDTLSSVNDLAALLERKGDYAGAELLHRRTKEGDERFVVPEYRRELAANERDLGLEHPDTLKSLYYVAGMLAKHSDYAGAEPLYRRALETQERVLGPDHPDTLTTVSALAELLQSKGDFESAEPLYRHVLEARERVLGPDHPDTVSIVSKLGSLLWSKGNYQDVDGGAETCFRREMEARERTLGLDHPDTLWSVSHLASVLKGKSNFQSAEPLYRRVLEARERLLGPEHPDTLASLNDLARLLAWKGDYIDAEPLHRRALDMRERVLGLEHLDTLMCVNDLARLLWAKKDYAKAEALYRRLLAAYERILGPEHLDTLTIISDLAGIQHRSGNCTDAEPLFRRALKTRERVLGPDHSDTLSSVYNLAFLLEDSGDYENAEPLFRRALETRERVLGLEHPDTLTGVNDLAVLLATKGDDAGAEPLLRRAQEAQARILGPDHPDTLASMSNLAELLSKKDIKANG